MAKSKNKESFFNQKEKEKRVNLLISTKQQLFLLIKYFILIFLFFPAFSGENENAYSEITIKTIGIGIQTIFRKRNMDRSYSCSIPDEIHDIDANRKYDYSNCNDNNEFCKINTNKNISNIKMKWTDKFDSKCREMFIGLTNITEVDLSKLGVPIFDMGNLFKNCSSLTYVNLTNVDTSQTTNLGNMFTNCSSLTSLNLSSFRTYEVKSIDRMFYNCSSLTSLNLSNFNTFKVTNFKEMFFQL